MLIGKLPIDELKARLDAGLFYRVGSAFGVTA
jgi:hypothetical protein